MDTIRTKVHSFVKFKKDGSLEHVAVNTQHSYWMSDEDVDLGLVEIDLPVPVNVEDKQKLAQSAIDTLIQKQQQVLARAHQTQQELQVKIDSLRMLPYLKPEGDNIIEVEPITEKGKTYDDDIPF